ncbi:hypothetical protein PanWU01x14_025020 [Parasponia andersonii]|uniref:DUF4283 domain-containing protein n=1 Tax=Parasponia andersonii TaxID=3476 RepID=A0A2P5DWS8_PARAD|nr:hypothetical protein PanWU01x14_025020 [Parasponia andersonii]
MEEDPIDVDVLVEQTSKLHCEEEDLDLKPNVYTEDRGQCINREHLIPKNVPPNLAVNDIDFSTTSFWVRILGLLRDLITVENSEKIAAQIGKLIEIYQRSLSVFFGGRYVRLGL